MKFNERNIPKKMQKYASIIVYIMKIYNNIPRPVLLETLAISGHLFENGNLSHAEKIKLTKMFRDYVL